MKIVNQYMTKNPYYKANQVIKLKGLFLHSLGVGQESAQVMIKKWNNPEYYRACVNGFIDQTGAYITLPTFEKPGYAMRGPHAGKKSTNNQYIGFEMTEPKVIKYVGGATFTCSDMNYARNFVEKNTWHAVELFARLCIFHHLNPLGDKVILSHAEGGQLGIASGHADPSHLWRQLNMPWDMNRFRQEVYTKMQEISGDDFMNKEQILKEIGDQYIKEFNEVPKWGEEDIRRLLDLGFINGGTSQATNPDDINMYLSDLKTIIVCKRMIEKLTGNKL